jgi:amino acid transporter
MVKQAENVRKRNPLAPIFGLIIGGGLLIAAILIVNTGIMNREGQSILPQVRATINAMGKDRQTGIIAVTVAVWLCLMGIAYFIVVLLAGKDPESVKDYPMPLEKEKKNKGKK